MGDRVRMFLAVELAAPIHAALVQLKRELARVDAPVRWVRDEGLHATVKFLGYVPADAVAALRGALQGAVGPLPPPTAAVRGLGAFPTFARATVLWVGLECQPLTQIAAAVDEALAPLGFAAENRPYHAHVTLGRVKDRQACTALAATLQAHRADEFGSCTLGELAAFRSDLRRDGAVYTKLWTIPFGG